MIKDWFALSLELTVPLIVVDPVLSAATPLTREDDLQVVGSR
jgi:hypothetical protein